MRIALLTALMHIRLFHSLALVLLMIAPAMEAHAQKSMGKTVPSAPEPGGDKEAPPTESKPMAPWQVQTGPEKPVTLMVQKSKDSKPVPMTVVRRGNLAIREGDIVVGTFGAELSSISYSRENAIGNPNMKWPKGKDGRVKVPYTFNANLPNAARLAINAAIADYKQFTCVDFVPRTSADSYFLDFFAEDGCWSEVGNHRRTGGQKVSIGRGCEYKGTAIHEMMHALGFDHEQNRPDRDSYITINWQNVESGMEDQFETCRDCTTQSLPYDYLSVMHYGRDFFSKNGLDTMVPKQRGATFSDGSSLTKMDIQKLLKLYQC